MQVLKQFYRRVRPWGFWGPVRDAVVAEDPAFPVNRNFRRDLFNVVIGTIVQTALVALPIYIVLRAFDGIAACLALVAVGGVILKKNWYDRLENA
jgi:SSS family solute:Na+ symporter